MIIFFLPRLQIFITKKLLRKYCCLDFTTMDHNILQIALLLRRNPLKFKMPASSKIMFTGILCSISSSVYASHGKLYNIFVVLWSKYQDL